MTDVSNTHVGIPAFATRGLTRLALALSFVGGFVLALGAVSDLRRVLYSYLAAFAFTASLSLGALVFLMIGHAMSASWPVAIRRLTEAIAFAITIQVLLFLPIAAGIAEIYPWASLSILDDGELLAIVEKKRAYLNPNFFVARSVFYFAVWGTSATVLLRWSRAQDSGTAATLAERSKTVSSAALPVVGLCLVFAAFDWLMSLSPAWFSTMYGVYYFAGGFLGALALVALLATYLGAPGRSLGSVMNSSHYYALGRLLFAFTVFWAYVAFFQFFIVYVADKPDEAPWYAVRRHDTWAIVSAALAIGRFVVPFSILLSYSVKRSRRALLGVSAWMLAMHYADVYWLVLPSLNEAGVRPHVFDAAALLFVGGAVVAFATTVARGAAAAPINDPRFAAALRYESQ